jgi:hypothetical protein
MIGDGSLLPIRVGEGESDRYLLITETESKKMKVSKAVEYLSEYKPDDEIFIAWWDKTYLEGSYPNINNDLWGRAIDLVEEQEYWSSVAGQALMDCVAEAEKENK